MTAGTTDMKAEAAAKSKGKAEAAAHAKDHQLKKGMTFNTYLAGFSVIFNFTPYLAGFSVIFKFTTYLAGGSMIFNIKRVFKTNWPAVKRPQKLPAEQTHRQTDRQTDRHADRYSESCTYPFTHALTHSLIYTHTCISDTLRRELLQERPSAERVEVLDGIGTNSQKYSLYCFYIATVLGH